MNIVDILKHRAATSPDKVAYIYLQDGEDDERILKYGELDQRARAIAAELQARNCRGERVILMYPQGLDFITAFFGCLYSGTVAVLLYPPTNEKMASRMNRIISDCSVFQVLTTQETSKQLHKLLAEKKANKRRPTCLFGDDNNVRKLSDIPWILTDQLEQTLYSVFKDETILPSDLAFLQYTSGSTGTPKGVMVTHENIIANQKAIQYVYQHTEASCTVSWLPMLHDMGLIGCTLQPLYVGYPLIFMSPLHFMQKPVRWLRAISRYRATSSGGPNFAFDYCVSKISPEEKESLDLSSWQVAFNGSEPVRSETMDRFRSCFAECDLNPHALIGVYGMAETTLIVSGTQPGGILPVDAATGYVSSGYIVPEHVLKIVDPESHYELPEGSTGEIWVSGPSITKGYWGRPEISAEMYEATPVGSHERCLRTGDMGYVKNNNLFVTGRIKDLIIIRGKNYHAEDLEWSLQGIQGVLDGFTAAFQEEQRDTDSLTIVAGVHTLSKEDFPSICEEIVSRIMEDHLLSVKRVVLIRPKSMPKTTSGKVQRRSTRALLANSGLQIVFDYSDAKQSLFTKGGHVQDANSPSATPTTDQELELVSIWSEVLACEKSRISLHDNFFSLGGSSLMMLELASRLDVSVELLFKYPTIHSFLSRSEEYQFPDVSKDIWLPPLALTDKKREPSNVSLITGANGLFGFHFLIAMLTRTQDSFICLMRGRNDEDVYDKFRKTADYYQLADKIDMGRIRLMCGDFGQEQLGLLQEQYDELSESVGRIYHIGSHVNNWLPYEGIKCVNVEGTRRLLTLAMTGRRKQFHYTSTSTFCPDREDKSIFYEADTICREDINKYNGYDISKYVSEALCQLARKEGIECNIYRMVWVGGQYESGLSKINDGFNIMLRMLITLGVYPRGNYLHDVIPVDLMADAMASLQSKAINTTFNLTSQSNESVDMLKVVSMLRDLGYCLKEVSREEFVRSVREYPDHKWDVHCRSYRQLVIRLFEEDVKPESLYDSRNVKTHVDPDVRERLERKCVDEWFRKAVLYLVRNDALPTPSGASYQDDLHKIAEWNNTDAPYSNEHYLHYTFEQWAERTPNAPALVFDDAVMTYAELNLKANQYANHLRLIGLEPEGLVGICLERSFELYAVILGILKAGGAYLPLCPSYPREVLAEILRDSGATMVVVSNETAPATATFPQAVRCINVCEIAGNLGAEPQSSAASTSSTLTAASLAYVIYTSGTTGKAKGVMIEHRGVINHNASIVERFGLSAKDNVLQFATMNFDSFVEEMFPVLSVGGRLTIIRDKDRLNIDRLKSIIRRCRVNVLKFPTAYWHSVAEESFEDLGVRMVGIGGEEADIRKYRHWVETNPSIPVINTYGPTEITITATVGRFEHGDAQAERLSLGTPIKNTKLHILDARDNPLPIGAIGELYISGHGLARGYMNRPEETRRVFIVNDALLRLYKTGDLARWRADGEIEFFGRNDNQVKVRGYRIELGAIESVLSSHPKIKTAAVVLKKVSDEKRLTAYVVATDVGAQGIKEFIRTRLPAFMTPDVIIPLAQLPMNSNGKVDRAELEKREIIVESELVDSSLPETTTETRMKMVWKNLLGIDRIGVDDDFSNLGGHSLLAINLLQKIAQEFGVKLSIDHLYSHSTIRKLSELMASSGQVVDQPSSIIEFPNPNPVGTDSSLESPLFLIHGVGGNLASFFPLVRNVKQMLSVSCSVQVPVFGIQINFASTTQFSSTEEMIHAYADHIIQIQPTGSYLIGGWSYGSSVAFLVGEELVRRGRRIKGFISLDAAAPKRHGDLDEFLEALAIRNARELYKDEHLAEGMKLFGAKLGFTGLPNKNLKLHLSQFLGYPENLNQQERDGYNMMAVTNMFNARGFAPNELKTDSALLIRASNSHFASYREEWLALLDSSVVTEHTVTGDHWSILNEKETAYLLCRRLVSERFLESGNNVFNSKYEDDILRLTRSTKFI